MFLGTALLAWLICSPLIGLSWPDFLARRRGASCFSSRVGAPLLLLWISEREIPRMLQAQVPRSYGLRNSYEMAYAEAGVELARRPALLTYADPVPNVFVIRGLGKDGALLFSDGLIAILEESELRLVLTRAIRHLLSPETVLQSACILALILIRKGFTAEAKVLRPVEALKSLMLFPWLRFYSSLAESGASRDDDTGARQKVAGHLFRAEKLYGQRAALPGLVYLGIER